MRTAFKTRAPGLVWNLEPAKCGVDIVGDLEISFRGRQSLWKVRLASCVGQHPPDLILWNLGE
jgi:hypothetical protein